jgi:hypothetical protein
LVTTGDGAAGERSGDNRRRMPLDELHALETVGYASDHAAIRVSRLSR